MCISVVLGVVTVGGKRVIQRWSVSIVMMIELSLGWVVVVEGGDSDYS